MRLHQQSLAAKSTSDGLDRVVDGGYRRWITLTAIRQYDHLAPASQLEGHRHINRSPGAWGSDFGLALGVGTRK